MSVIADGVDKVRKAAREELRKGASQIKVFASGGVVFPAEGHPTRYEYSPAELAAIVEEAAARGTYVMAHVYTDEGVQALPRCRRALDRARQFHEPGDDGAAQRRRRVPRSDLHLARPARRERGRDKPSRRDRRQSSPHDRPRQAGLWLGQGTRRADRPRHRFMGAGRPEIAAPRVRTARRYRFAAEHSSLGDSGERRTADAEGHARHDRAGRLRRSSGRRRRPPFRHSRPGRTGADPQAHHEGRRQSTRTPNAIHR